MNQNEGMKYLKFHIDPELPWEMRTDRNHIHLVRRVRFEMIQVAVTKVDDKIGQVSINESGFAPHMHVQGDIDELFQEISFAMHQDLVGGMDDEELITHNADDLILLSCAGARRLIDEAWHPSTDKQTVYWHASHYKETTDD